MNGLLKTTTSTLNEDTIRNSARRQTESWKAVQPYPHHQSPAQSRKSGNPKINYSTTVQFHKSGNSKTNYETMTFPLVNGGARTSHCGMVPHPTTRGLSCRTVGWRVPPHYITKSYTLLPSDWQRCVLLLRFAQRHPWCSVNLTVTLGRKSFPKSQRHEFRCHK
jgi:hypothetical protein